MTDLQQVELDLLKKFDLVCKKHKLKYFMYGGSLIGAIRHSGFIPWDDDIDVVMPADDYFKICEIAADEFKDKYFWQTEISDPGSLRFHGQLRNSETTCILKHEYNLRHTFNNGVFIDIFPLYNLPDDKRVLAKLYELVTIMSKNRNHKMYLKFENLARMLNMKSTYVGTIWRHEHFDKFLADDFSETISSNFEDMIVPIPKNYDNILTTKYGNWRQPKHSKTTHGELITDINTSYKNFK